MIGRAARTWAAWAGLLWAPAAWAAETGLPQRPYDPVALRAKDLGGALLGARLSEIRAFAMRGEALAAIPFQIDERSDDGRLILTGGPGKGKIKDKGGDWVPAPNLGIASAEDEIVLRAVDAGPRAPAAAWPAGASEAAELRLEDPISGDAGFVYLARFEKDAPPLSEARYLRYEITKGKGGFEVENVRTPRYHVAFSDPDAPFAYTDLRIARDDDGRSWGPDFLDAFRFLISIDTLLVNFVFKTENLLPERLGYIEGPLRATRRIHLKIKFLGLVIPEFLVKAFSDIELDTDSFYYPMHFYFAASLGIPEFVVRRAEDSYGVFTTDFNEKASGGFWADSRNAGGNVAVDGRMDEAEKGLDLGVPDWMLMAGPSGGWMNVVHVGEGFADVGKKLHYLDNALETPTEEEEDLPEFRKAYGSSGYRFDDFSKIRIGAPLTFETYIFALPPGFKKGDEGAYARILSAPVRVSAGEVRRRPAPEGERPAVGY